MKTTRTRMLIVFLAAAVVISFFMHWEEVARGFRQGWKSSLSKSFYESTGTC